MSLLLTWGINNGHVWDYSVAGPAGLTILHLAALLNDGGKVADELTGILPCLAASLCLPCPCGQAQFELE